MLARPVVDGYLGVLVVDGKELVGQQVQLHQAQGVVGCHAAVGVTGFQAALAHALPVALLKHALHGAYEACVLLRHGLGIAEHTDGQHQRSHQAQGTAGGCVVVAAAQGALQVMARNEAHHEGHYGQHYEHDQRECKYDGRLRLVVEVIVQVHEVGYRRKRHQIARPAGARRQAQDVNQQTAREGEHQRQQGAAQCRIAERGEQHAARGHEPAHGLLKQKVHQCGIKGKIAVLVGHVEHVAVVAAAEEPQHGKRDNVARKAGQPDVPVRLGGC